MEARIARVVAVAAALLAMGASYRTPNFLVTAPTQEFAKQVGDAAEAYRRDLAQLWLQKELPRWAEPCPIFLQVGPTLGAGGATSFVFDHGEVFGWHMTIQGTPERILDSVLPHEVTHTIFASHFRRPLPRWADEGACTTVEHETERRKQQQMLVQFLQTGRGIAFGRMFAMREYPQDVMPLYSQGYSLCRFLIQQGGRQKFINFIGEGMRSEQWTPTTQQFYGFANLGQLQTTWLDWVAKGSPKFDLPEQRPGQPEVLVASTGGDRKRPEPNLIYRGQSEDKPSARPQPKVALNNLASLPGPADLTERTAANEGWHAKENQQLASRGVAAAPSRTAAVPASDKNRKVLLEWSRDSQPPASQSAAELADEPDPTPPVPAAPASQRSYPRDAQARQAAVYDAAHRGGTILR